MLGEDFPTRTLSVVQRVLVPAPARSCVQVAALARSELFLEIEAFAII